MYMTDERPVGVAVDDLAARVALEGAALDRKLAALGAMASQTREVMTTLDPDLYAAEIAEEGFVGRDDGRRPRHDRRRGAR